MFSTKSLLAFVSLASTMQALNLEAASLAEIGSDEMPEPTCCYLYAERDFKGLTKEYCLEGQSYVAPGEARSLNFESMKCGHATNFELVSGRKREKGIGYYENASFGWTLSGFSIIIVPWTTPTLGDTSNALGATLHTNSDCTGESGIVTGTFSE